MSVFVVDPHRARAVGHTGIFVPAMLAGTVGSYDVAWLDASSLVAWVRSAGGRNPLAEFTLGLVMGHRREDLDAAVRETLPRSRDEEHEERFNDHADRIVHAVVLELQAAGLLDATDDPRAALMAVGRAKLIVLALLKLQVTP